jgi:phosphoglycolate phosphatase
MMPVDVAVLDVDGTVSICSYDFDAMRAAVGRAALRHGIDTSALGIRGIIEQIDAVARMLGGKGPGFRRETDAVVAAMEIEAAQDATLVPGVNEALSQLRRDGMAVALITRNCRAATEIVLRGFREYDVLLTRDDVPRAKPDPDHVLRSLAALQRGPETGVLVGDHDFDIQAGRAAGMRFCLGVRTGTATEENLRQAGADAVLDTVAELPDWLRGVGGDGAR